MSRSVRCAAVALIAAGVTLAGCSSAPAEAPVPGQASSSSPSAPPPIFTVTGVTDAGDLTVSNGMTVRDTAWTPLYTAEQHDDPCKIAAGIEALRQVLVGRRITDVVPPDTQKPGRTPEARLYFAGSTGHDTMLAELAAAETKAVDACPDEAPPVTSQEDEPSESNGGSSSSSSGGHVDVDVHHHNLPDGALTGGFCRRHRWC